MYTVIRSHFVKIANHELIQRVEIICDTEEELPTVENIDNNKYDVGSLALIANTHEIKILNHQGEWI